MEDNQIPSETLDLMEMINNESTVIQHSQEGEPTALNLADPNHSLELGTTFDSPIKSPCRSDGELEDVSPSRLQMIKEMTSPQRRKLYGELQIHGKQVTKKAKQTLREVDKVRAEMRAVLLNSEKISRHYSSTLQRIEDNAEKERENVLRKKQRSCLMVEPNLTRRNEEKQARVKLMEQHKRSQSQLQPYSAKDEYKTNEVSRKYVDTFAIGRKSLARSELRAVSVLDDVSEEDCDVDGNVTLPSITHKSQVGRPTRTLSQQMAESALIMRSRTKIDCMNQSEQKAKQSPRQHSKIIFSNKPGQQFAMQLMPMLRHRSIGKMPNALSNSNSSYNVNVYQQQPATATVHRESSRTLKVQSRTTQNKPRKEKALKTKRVQRSSHKKTMSSVDVGSHLHQNAAISSQRAASHNRSNSRQSSSTRKQFKILAAALHAPKKENRPDEPQKPLDKNKMTREAFARAVLQSNMAKENESTSVSAKKSKTSFAKYFGQPDEHKLIEMAQKQPHQQSQFFSRRKESKGNRKCPEPMIINMSGCARSLI